VSRVQEPIVSRDKRKIEPSGQARGERGPASDGPDPDASTEAAAPAPAATEDSREKATGAKASDKRAAEARSAGAGARAADAEPAVEPAGEPGTNMGQPGTPVAHAPAADADRGTAQGAKQSAKEGAKVEQTGAKSGPSRRDSAGAEGGGVDTITKPAKGLGAELEALRGELDERLRDLQRVTAEYANYRKRVERDRGVMAEQAVAMVLASLLPILDDLDRARDHGDLVGPFGAVAEQLTTALAKFGLTGFGEQGDAFDPTRHEAVAHQTSAEVTEPTCVAVMRRGYMLGDRLLRAALVAVADPE
jgi:molecular chaperone GrpE